MKRLCVFYKNAAAYAGKPIEWIVCKGCQRKLQKGDHTPNDMMILAKGCGNGKR